MLCHHAVLGRTPLLLPIMKRHIEERHGVKCLRGDADVLTVPLLDKIRGYVEKADVLIADCSGRNANVFYELGMAHSLGKKVILITKDAIEEAPVDIRHYEFIRYELTKDKEFLDSLDKALRTIFIDRYDDLYEKAIEVFEEFRKVTNSKAKLASKELFVERVVAAEQHAGILSSERTAEIREFLMLRIIADKDDRQVIGDMNNWFQNELASTSKHPPG
jgi:hypothetical protein